MQNTDSLKLAGFSIRLGAAWAVAGISFLGAVAESDGLSLGVEPLTFGVVLTSDSLYEQHNQLQPPSTMSSISDLNLMPTH